MTDADEIRLTPAAVEALYAEFSSDLLAFLIGVLRDGELAEDVLQATFARAVESGHAAQRESVRGWLFRVAFNEALSLRRMQGQQEKLIRKAAWDCARESVQPDDRVHKSEVVAEVRRALEDLPSEQAAVVRMRIYEQMKFAEIAEQLGVPLGTVLTRMRLALRKLESRFEGWQR